MTTPAHLDLSWLPLGAGGHVVRWNGRVYERWQARRRGDVPRDLYHAALEVFCDGERYVIEMAPVWNERTPDRGVRVEGPVGLRVLGHLRLFRYEVRCWRDGVIPDLGEAVDSPVRVSDSPEVAAEVLRLVGEVPSHVWGRDVFGCGDMWNSNSLVAWLLTCTVPDVAASLTAPANGRAPGWASGVLEAQRRRSVPAPLR
jgi:hypothetical protein